MSLTLKLVVDREDERLRLDRILLRIYKEHGKRPMDKNSLYMLLQQSGSLMNLMKRVINNINQVDSTIQMELTESVKYQVSKDKKTQLSMSTSEYVSLDRHMQL